ncbi:MAG: aryl-sulfate sulfotransferase [Myxococcota bacterium]
MGRDLVLLLTSGCVTAEIQVAADVPSETTPTLPTAPVDPPTFEPEATTWVDDDLTVTVFPTQLLRVDFTTKTAEAATILVSWSGREGLRVEEDEPSTDHTLDLLGPPPETEVTVRVELAADDRTIELVTPPVPEWIPAAHVITEAPDAASIGWTLTNIVNHDLRWPASAVIYDAAGAPVWHYTPLPDTFDDRGDTDVRLTLDQTILIGPAAGDQPPVEVMLDGTRVWEGPVLDPSLHHHFDKLDDGTYLGLQWVRPTDRVIVFDPDHTELWSWTAHEHLPGDVPDVRDFLHVNSLTLTDDALYVSSRELSCLFKVDPITGEVRWRLGRDLDFTLLAGTWFEGQHDPELQPDGHWLVYDNTLEGPSRVVELAIDEVAMTAEVVWEFPGEAQVDAWYTEGWFSPIWGDAERRSNGDVRVTNGNRSEKRSRIFDVRHDGTVAWAIDFDVGVGVYRSEPLQVVGGRPRR